MSMPSSLIESPACPVEWPTITFDQGCVGSVSVTLRDRNGNPFVLSNKAQSCVLICKEYETAYGYQIYKLCRITDGPNGVVSFDLTPSDLASPGIWLGEFQLAAFSSSSSSRSSVSSSSRSSQSSHSSSRSSSSSRTSSASSSRSSVSSDSSSSPSSSSRSSHSSGSSSRSSSSSRVSSVSSSAMGGSLVYAKVKCYIEIVLSLTDQSPRFAPLSISEIRMAIRDRCPADNFLLENVEFSNTEIAWAIRRPIDYWNEAKPPIPQTYTPVTFPYRYHWTDAVIGELLRIAAFNLTRNRMPIQAGGLSADDKIRADMYLRLSDGMIKEYKSWVASEKYSLNLQAGYGRSTVKIFGGRSY